MIGFRAWIEMAMPREQDKAKVYYHGTSSLVSAKGIVANGIDPSKTIVKYNGRKKAQLFPQAGRVYITPNLRYAVIYALGGSYIGSKMPTSWEKNSPEESSGVVFEIPGEQLSDITPDEDQVGAMLHYAMMATTPEKIANLQKYYTDVKWDVFLNSSMLAEFKRLSKYCLTEKQFKDISSEWGKGSEYAVQASIGKKMMKCINDSMKHWLIDCGAHVAHAGALHPSQAWIIDKRDSEKLAADCSNFFHVARLWR